DIHPGDRVLLIVENDLGFARFLLDVAREYGWKGVLAHRGGTALALAHDLHATAITLDINLPDLDGWRVLDRLKHDATTRHIPVQGITTEDERRRALRMGARGVLQKPVRTRDVLDETFTRIQRFIATPVRRLLLVASDAAERAALTELLAGPDVSILP